MTLPSGIPIDKLDPGIRPQDDLLRHINGGWLARTEFPPTGRATARSGFWLTRPRTRSARPWKRPGAATLPDTGRRWRDDEDQRIMLSSAGSQVSSKVQQHPRTAASSDDRQHTQQAGTTTKRPAAPPVRDEEAAGSNEGPVLLRPCCTNLPVDTVPGTCLGAGRKSRAAAGYAPSGMPSRSVGTRSPADTESSAAGPRLADGGN